MSELFIGILARVAVVVIGVKLWLWSRRLRAASASAWRRRMGTLLFLAPLLLWLGGKALPPALQWPLRGLVVVDRVVGAAPKVGVRLLAPAVPRPILIGLEPLFAAGAYTLAGIVLGWPLDRLRGAKRQGEGEGEGDDGGRRGDRGPAADGAVRV